MGVGQCGGPQLTDRQMHRVWKIEPAAGHSLPAACDRPLNLDV